MDKVLPYVSLSGRANRRRYWLTSLAVYGVLIVAFLLGTVLPIIGWVVGGLGLVTALWASFAVAVRRLHDRAKSAWWLVAMYLPVLVLSALSSAAGAAGGADAEGASGFFALLSLPFSIWTFVELGCLRGTAGANRFGPDPLASSPAEVFA